MPTVPIVVIVKSTTSPTTGGGVSVAGSTDTNSAGPSFDTWIVKPAGSFTTLPTCGLMYVTVT